MNIYYFDSQGFFINENEATPAEPPDVGFHYPNNATTEPPPDLPEGKLAKWNGASWELVDAPSLDEVKAKRIGEIDAKTEKLIFAGFDYSVPDGTLDAEGVDQGGETFHFSFDQLSQLNFTDGVISATMGQVLPWRAWDGEAPYLLTLPDAQAFIALAQYGKAIHTQGIRAAGWALTDAVRVAATAEEVEAIVDTR